jgi:luciferase family oxidoreductase group 1
MPVTQMPIERRSAAKGQIALGVIDFGIVTPDTTAANVLAQTKRCARLAESLGYSRYWLVEHHEAHCAWTSPEIMIPILAEKTTRIRLGSAAVLLHAYSPLKVAEVFRLLELLVPGRVDLGVCGGVPLDEVARTALLDGATFDPSRYSGKVVELLAYLRNQFPPGHRFERGATPLIQGSPEIWLMGSGGSAGLAAQHGTAFSYSLFHRGSAQDPTVLDGYCDRFRCVGSLREARCNIAVSVICAETEEAARQQRASIEQLLGGDMRVNFSGTPEQCRERFLELQHRMGTDELIVHSLWHGYEERLASYRMLAEVCGLAAQSEPKLAERDA